jgi:hypothetical protein
MTKKSKSRTRLDPIEKMVYSIKEFCEAHDLSVAYYYILRQQGAGPKEMKVGRRWLISKDAAAAWRKRRERGQGPDR